MTVKENSGTVNIIKNILPFVTAALITVCAFVFRADVLTVLPLYISIGVTRLQSDANRYMLLVGALNSLLYCFAYCTMGLYASAAYALLFSFTMQLISFLRWNKRKYADSTEFRKLTKKQFLFALLAFAALWVFEYFVFSRMKSGYMLLDNTVSAVGIASTVLCMFAFVEYTYSMLLGNTLSLILYITMLPETPSRMTYIIMTLYSTVGVVMAFFKIRRLYREQRGSPRGQR